MLFWKLKIFSHTFACEIIFLTFKFIRMTVLKNGEKMVQTPIPLELYAKVCQYAAENRRNLRQQIIFDMEKMYSNVKLRKEYVEKFGLHANNVSNVGLQNTNFQPPAVNYGNTDDEEDLL